MCHIGSQSLFEGGGRLHLSQVTLFKVWRQYSSIDRDCCPSGSQSLTHTELICIRRVVPGLFRSPSRIEIWMSARPLRVQVISATATYRSHDDTIWILCWNITFEPT